MRAGIEQGVHVGVVAVRPRGHVLGHELAFGPAGTAGQHHAGYEGDDRQHAERTRSANQLVAPGVPSQPRPFAHPSYQALCHLNAER